MPLHPFLSGILLVMLFTVSLTGCQSAQLRQAWNSGSSNKLANSKKTAGKKEKATITNSDSTDSEDNNNESLTSLAGGSQTNPSSESEKIQKQIKDDMAQGLRAASEARYDVARIHFLRVLQDDPDNSEAHHHLAMVADQQQDFAKAEYHYRQALSSNPRDPKLLSDIGWSLILQKKLQESESYLREALKYDARNKTALNRLGYLYAQLNNYDQALAMFRMTGSEQEAQANMAELFPQGMPLPQNTLAQNSALQNRNNFGTAQQTTNGFHSQNNTLQTIQHTQNNLPSVNPQGTVANNTNTSPFYAQNNPANSYSNNSHSHQLSAPTPWNDPAVQQASHTGAIAPSTQQANTNLPVQQYPSYSQPSYSQSTPFHSGSAATQQSAPSHPTNNAMAGQQHIGQAFGGSEAPPFNTAQRSFSQNNTGMNNHQQQAANPVINPANTQTQQPQFSAAENANPLDSMPAWPFSNNTTVQAETSTTGHNIPNWPGNQAPQNNHALQYNGNPPQQNAHQPTPATVQQAGFEHSLPDWPGNQQNGINQAAQFSAQPNPVVHAHGIQNGQSNSYQNAQTQAAYQGMNIGPGQMFPVVNPDTQQQNIQQNGVSQIQNTYTGPTISPGQSHAQSGWPQQSGSNTNTNPGFPNPEQTSGNWNPLPYANSAQAHNAFPTQSLPPSSNQRSAPQPGMTTGSRAANNPYWNYASPNSQFGNGQN